MDPKWHCEDSNTRCGCAPKIVLTGRLEAKIAGQLVEIEAADSKVTVRVESLKTAWLLRRSINSFLLSSVRDQNISLSLKIGTRVNLNVLPQPSTVVRWVVPALHGSRKKPEQ